MSEGKVNAYLEEGDVEWVRSWDEASAKAKAEGKPIFLQFQEIPGCSNCTRFGKQILQHPQILAAIKHYFVPCLVNNTGKTAKDAAALKKFGEPSWNNPVVRLVTADGKDLIPREDEIYDAQTMLDRMLASLETFGIKYDVSMLETVMPAKPVAAAAAPAAKSPFPPSLTAGVPAGTSLIWLEMGCYWTGEGCVDWVLKDFDGFVCTHSGWMSYAEIVEIAYDPSRFDVKSFLQEALKYKIFSAIYYLTDEQKAIALSVAGDARYVKKADISTRRTAGVGEQKYHLLKSPYSTLTKDEHKRITLNGLVWAVRQGYATEPTKEQLADILK